MKAVGIKDIGNNLSAHLREVRSGARILVSDRNTVVAELHEPGGVYTTRTGDDVILSEWIGASGRTPRSSACPWWGRDSATGFRRVGASATKNRPRERVPRPVDASGTARAGGPQPTSPFGALMIAATIHAVIAIATTSRTAKMPNTPHWGMVCAVFTS